MSRLPRLFFLSTAFVVRAFSAGMFLVKNKKTFVAVISSLLLLFSSVSIFYHHHFHHSLNSFSFLTAGYNINVDAQSLGNIHTHSDCELIHRFAMQSSFIAFLAVLLFFSLLQQRENFSFFSYLSPYKSNIRQRAPPANS